MESGNALCRQHLHASCNEAADGTTWRTNMHDNPDTINRSGVYIYNSMPLSNSQKPPVGPYAGDPQSAHMQETHSRPICRRPTVGPYAGDPQSAHMQETPSRPICRRPTVGPYAGEPQPAHIITWSFGRWR